MMASPEAYNDKFPRWPYFISLALHLFCWPNVRWRQSWSPLYRHSFPSEVTDRLHFLSRLHYWYWSFKNYMNKMNDKKFMFVVLILRCHTLLFKSNGIYFSNAYLIYRSSIFWSNILTWHLSGVLWGGCEISHDYDYSSRLSDHSKSVRFEKRDIKTLATGTVFGGYFIIRDRLLWEFKLFLFHGIVMTLVHKITVCVSGLEIKLNPFITKYSQNHLEIP